MWFRSDLRTSDNAALAAAGSVPGATIVACFAVCAEQWREHDMAGVKVDFILRGLQDLSKRLAELNIPLLIILAPRFENVPEAMVRLASGHSCRAVFFNDEYEINERRRDDAVVDALAAAGVEARRFTDQVLVAPGEVRTGEGRYFTVFTPFRKALYRAIDERGGVVLHDCPRKQAPTGITPSPVPERVAGFASRVPSDLWPAGEAAAAERLDRFVRSGMRVYGDRRDLPALDGTSALSPYLSVGAVSVRQCVLAAMGVQGGRLEGASAGATQWISELAWREFYKHVLVGYPRVCMGRAFKPQTDRIRWSKDDRGFSAWCEGRTGVPIVDAGMRQLKAIGWMHNRVRMITAMYLSKDLFIDWRLGERHFMQHLVDGDLGSNNGGWQWSASTGTDAAPYFRIFNPVTQSRRFDADGAYIRRYVPELADLEGGEKGAIHDPEVLPDLARARLDYPRPIVDHAAAKARVTAAFRALSE